MKGIFSVCAALALAGNSAVAHEACEAAHGERGVEVGESAASAIGLRLARAERRRVQSAKRYYGRIVADPQADRIVALPMAGFVTLCVRLHDDVESGAELLRVSSPDAAAQFAEIETRAARLEALERAGAKNAALAAETKAMKASFAAMTRGLKPVDAASGVFALLAQGAGRVTEVMSATGGFLERGASVLRVAERRAPAVLALVPVSDARALQDGLGAVAGAAHGTIRLDRTRTDGLVGVWVTGLADDSLVQGETVRVALESGSDGAPVLCVPSSAVFMDGLSPSVFVRDAHDADRMVVKKVGVGISSGGWTQVEGLKEGEEVVSEGVYELRHALPSAGGEKKEAGHFHADGQFHAGSEEHE